MKAVMKLLYPDERKVTITMSEVETSDAQGDTLGNFLSNIVESALDSREAIEISVVITRDTEDTPT